MKTLNVRLVAILLGSALAFGVIVYFVHRMQVRRYAHVFLRQADEWQQKAEDARDEGDIEGEKKAYTEAVRKLGSYADLVPDDVNAVEKLGLLLADLGDYGGAYSTLEKVLRQDPDRMNIRRRLVEVAMTIGRFPDAREHLEIYLLPSVPDNGELLEMLGLCQIRSGENDEAVDSFQRSIENSPQRVVAYQWLARVLLDRNRRLGPDLEADRLTQADAWMKKLLASNAGSPRAHLVYVEYAANLSRINSMDDAWKHPILLEEMVPSLLLESVKRVITRLDLPSDDADLRRLEKHHAVLTKAVKQVVQTLRSDLMLDDPAALLRTARLGVRLDNMTDEDFNRAKDETLAALEAELSPEENEALEALQTAAKHGVIVDAAKNVLGLLGNRAAMLLAAQLGVLDDAISHASTARTFLAADRAALAAAEKEGVLAAAIEQALEAEQPDALGLTSRDETVAVAVGRAAEGVQLPEDAADARPKAAKQQVVVDAVRSAFTDRQLIADDRERLFEVVQQEGSLARIVARTVKARDTEMEQDDRRAILLLARVVLAKRDYDRFRSYLEEGIELYPDDVRMYSLLANIDQQTGRMEEAIAGLRKGLQATDNDPLLLWKMAQLLIDAEEIDEAKQVIEQLVTAQYGSSSELPPTDVAESFLQALLAHRQGQWVAAGRGLEQLRGRLTEWPDLLQRADALLGACYAQLGDVGRQLAAYRRVLDADPFHRPSLAGMADGLTRTGKTEEALKYYRRLATRDPNGMLPLARMLLRANLRKPLAERQWTEIQDLLNQAAEADPESAPLAILQAEVRLSQDRAPEAVDILNTAWQKQPENTALWGTLVALEQQLENWDRVEELLEAADVTDDAGAFTIGDEVARLLVRIRYETQRYEDEASRLLEAALKIAQAMPPEADHMRALSGLLSVALQSREEAQARQICQEIAALDPTNIRIRFLLFQLTISTKDEAAMQEALAQIEKIEGKGAYWLYGSAVVLSLPVEDGQDERLDQALELLAQAGRKRPGWGQVLLLTAGIYDQKGDRELALQNYVDAIEMGGGNPIAYRRAVELLTRAGRHAEAAEIMNLLLAGETMLSQEDMRLQRGVDWGTGDLDSSLQLARDVAENSQQYQDHVWLGRLLAQKAQRAKEASQAAEAQQMTTEAEGAFLRAVELEDTTALTWGSLISFYSANGETQKAEQALAKAETRIPADDTTLAMAQIYEAMGRAEEAQKHYENAANVTPDDVDIVQRLVHFYLRNGKVKQAETQLKRIISGKLKADQEVVAWARRRQAGILSAQPGYQNLQRAIGLIEANLAAEGPSAQDTRLLAGLLARSPSRTQQERAIRSLEGLPSPLPEDQFTLARLYLSHGNWAKGVASMRGLLARYGDQPQYLAAYVDAMLKRDQLQSVEIYLNSLERLVPNQFAVVNLRADFLFRQGQFLPALDLMTGFLNRRDAIPTDEGQRLALVATRLEQFLRRLNELALKAKTDSDREALEAMAGRYAQESERMYRAYVSDRPSYRMLLAAFLGRQGKIDEALELLEQVWSDGPPEVIAQMSVILLKSPAATADQLRRADKVLQAALSKYDTSTQLRLAAGDIRSFQGRYQESEAIYRAMLRTDRENVIAKNNLAVLLALQKIKLDEAAKLIDEAIAAAGPIGSMLDSRATVNMALGRPQKALDDLALAIVQDPSAIRLFHRAQALQQAGQRAEALKAWQQAHDAGLDADVMPKLEQSAYAQLEKHLKSE